MEAISTQNGYEILWEFNASEMYEWNVVAIVRNSERPDEFAVYSDSGCSCNGPYELNEYNDVLAWFEDLSWTRDLYEIGARSREAIRYSGYATAQERAAGHGSLHRVLSELKREAKERE
jgi:hypothetical protein